MMIRPRSIDQSSFCFDVTNPLLFSVDDAEDMVHSLLIEVQSLEDQGIDCMIFTLAHY